MYLFQRVLATPLVTVVPTAARKKIHPGHRDEWAINTDKDKHTCNKSKTITIKAISGRVFAKRIGLLKHFVKLNEERGSIVCIFLGQEFEGNK